MGNVCERQHTAHHNMLSLLSRILARLLCRQNIRRVLECNPIRQNHPGLILGMKTSRYRILPKQTLLVLL